MPSRRDVIRMSREEIDEFLAGKHTINVATLGSSGWPHLVALWYGFYEGKIAFWTFAKSQKIINIRRDDKVSALIEDGSSYHELRGVEIEGRATIFEDQSIVRQVGNSVFERYEGGTGSVSLADFMASAPKRVAIVIESLKMVTWDHSKLGNTY